MSMSKKLYVNFGIILTMVVMLFLVTWYAVHREHDTKAAAAQADKVRSQIMQNRLYLANYLLSGDSREVEHMNAGISQLREDITSCLKLASSEEQHTAIAAVQKNEDAWVSEFAQPLLEKRKQVDSGNATVADIQIYYLQKDAGAWVKASNDALDSANRDAQNADRSAGTLTIAIALIGTLIALVLGGAIAYQTANSITRPLSELIRVAQQIGESGDLDHEIDIRRDDEIGQLGRTFGTMVTYLKEMATVS